MKPVGKVILAGAGPGDPELITVKVMRYLHKADVVITDRLVSPAILSQYVNAGATLYFVGKEGGSEKSMSQEDINDLLVQQAKQNKLVVRLKGGDVSFFSNVLAELNALTEHEIPYEIIPGVTSASGAAAYAGIPLTARGYAASVRFLTLQRPGDFREETWKELVNTQDTLVFYMSSAVLPALAAKFVEHKISPEKLLAIIEQATTPFQRVYIHNFYKLPPQWMSYQSPALVIVGRVVNLHAQFNWKGQATESAQYFNSAGDLVELKKSAKAD